jgi:hypothetical protein
MIHMELKKTALIVASLLTPSLAIALDASCAPMVSASEARISQPAWHSIAVMNGNFRMELIKASGAYFQQVGGAWSKSEIDLDAAEKDMIARLRSGEVKISQCSSGTTEVLDGVEVYSFKSRIEMQGAPAQESTLYIGKADGLPYKQVGKTVTVSYK